MDLDPAAAFHAAAAGRGLSSRLQAEAFGEDNHRPGRPYRETWIFTVRKPAVADA